MATEHQHDDIRPDRGLAAKLAGIPSGRRMKWLVIAFWIAILAIAGPFAGSLQEVEENDAASFRPEDAESLRAAELEEQFQQDETTSAVIVYHRDEGLADADHARIEADRRRLAGTFGEAAIGPAVPSENGRAALYSAVIPDDNHIIENVEEIRETIGGAEAGLEVKVTGPAGLTTDLVAVFADIDITLLLAAAGVVTVLLLITYRSPLLWGVPLIAVGFAHVLATAGVYAVAKAGWITVNGQSGGILPVLVFGVGTDYALLLIARYREELQRHEDKHEAMAFALRRAGPAVLASASTVVIGLLCLLASDLNSNQSLGPVGALGILAAFTALMTALPALLVIFGRRIFWPFVPHYGIERVETAGIWSRIGGWVGQRARPVWVVTALVLAVFALGLVKLDTNLPPEDQFTNEPEAIAGQKLIAESYPAGTGQPSTVIARTSATEEVLSAILSTPGVAGAEVAGEAGDLVSFSVVLEAEPGTDVAFDTVKRLRESVHAIPGADAVVGGPDASSLDIATTNARDLRVLIPLVLAAVLVVLAVLLRSILAPLMLIASVVLSYGAALGVSVIIFEEVFGFAAVEPSVPLLGFVFLVALGIDYNIFLMSRVHEEAARIGTHRGMLRGLATTGGVITSAGLVLAGTFSVLGLLPLVAMAEVGFLVAFGVLLDTFIVRSILVPALTFDIGRHIWWPSRLARSPETAPVPKRKRQPAHTV